MNENWIPKHKILTVAQAEAKAKELKEDGKIVGFTNGCFDCLHLGHVYSLMEAKKECDVLFVGLNSDASIKKLKGEDRPLQNELTRAVLLASMEFIDYVIIFGDDTALPLVEAIQPDVIAKEGYTIDRWPEGQYVASYGGKVVTLPRLEGYSTTCMVEKIKK
ncbi:MAG: adenylyltransferase/cytidyltransferase family protein [Lactobacillales bacterium]|jgi:D-beta-D-heptose 7-phosphate kinase/D-beta-D-heptose 1-phosphate adenosyltransferase|nr:adenylyltransferase/cytidyltransferase family protein [Lactobacillales bacterium]